MSRFSNALARAIQETEPSQTAFAAKSGIDFRQLNKYVRGTVDCGAANIQLIARALPEQQRADVVAAWLRDLLPDVANGLVSIISNANARTADLAVGSIPSDDLSPALHQAVVYLLDQARTHPAVSDMLIGLARALRGAD